MEKLTLKFNIIQVDSIDTFYWNGLPHLHFHYFFKNKTGGFDWLWIDEKTDFEWLQEKINEGLIYINE